MSFFKRLGAFFFDIIETFVVALAIFVICYLFLFQFHQVNGASMLPNFQNSEMIITDKISYRLKPPEKGDIVIFRAPKNRELDYIKRIIAVPGDKVELTNAGVFINGEKLKEDYLDTSLITSEGAFLRYGQSFLVPENEYIVFGDNRPHSSDSREWGTITKDDLIGKVFLRIWPLNKFGLISHAKE